MESLQAFSIAKSLMSNLAISGDQRLEKPQEAQNYKPKLVSKSCRLDTMRSRMSLSATMPKARNMITSGISVRM